ncbi:hypothetical protein LCGC14_2996610, partial [marine sediment metagenome]
MRLKVSKVLAEYLGESKLRSIGLEYNTRGYRDYFEVDLSDLTKQQTATLREWLDETVKLGVRGGKILVRDIDVWNKALTDAGNQHARTVNQFSSLLTEHLRKVDGHRIYQRMDTEGIAHVCYYVNGIEYHPENRSRDYYSPPETEMKLLFYELGGRTGKSVHFLTEDIHGLTASEALAKAGFLAETPELRKAYLKETRKFNKTAPLIGKQYIAQGTGANNLDGSSRRSWGGSSKFLL